MPGHPRGVRPRLHANFQLYTIRADGTHKRQITDGGSNSSPSVSPNGRTVAFDRGLSGDIFTVAINGQHLRRIIGTPGFDRSPAFSGPFGNRIAYAHFPPQSHSSNIWVALSDGSSRTKLTDSKHARNLDPAFSPDGRKIAFSRSRRSGHSEIYVMRSDGTRVHRLTDTAPGKSSATPCFSPSGKRIVFARFRENESAIFIMRRNGTHVHRLTRRGVFDDSPAFSPNGQRIAFARSKFNSEGQIMVMRRNGTHVHKLTNTRVDEETPDWAAR